jgi:hypothetical protein
VGDPVAAADRLGHGVAERKSGRTERSAGVLRPPEQASSGFEVLAVLEHPRQPFADQAGAA